MRVRIVAVKARSSQRALRQGLSAAGGVWARWMAVAVVGMGAALLSEAQAAGAVAIYPSTDQADRDIAAALRQAEQQHKRVLIDFGGNWCGDCIVLDANLKLPENAALLAKFYVMVHVNVGDEGIDHNQTLAQRYGIPLKKGVPALAVTEPNGTVVYAQQNGEFESMRRMDPSSVNEFLNRWKPAS